MTTNSLAKLYDKLSSRERMPLIIAAFDRGDDAEADRLSRSAPRAWRRLPDYHGLGEGLMLLTLFHVIQLEEKAAQFWQTLAYLNETSSLPDRAKGSPELVRRLENVVRMWGYLYTVEADAWTRLMEELQINPQTLLQDMPYYEALREMEETIRLMAFTDEQAEQYIRERDQKAQLRTVETTQAEMRGFLEKRIEWWS